MVGQVPCLVPLRFLRARVVTVLTGSSKVPTVWLALHLDVLFN